MLKNQINNLTLYLKELEKEQLMMPKASRRKEIRKIRAEINDKETTTTTKNEISETRRLVFKKKKMTELINL